MVLFTQTIHLVLALCNFVVEVVAVVAVEEDHEEAYHCQTAYCQKPTHFQAVESSGNGLHPEDVHYDGQLSDRVDLLHYQVSPCCQGLCYNCITFLHRVT